MVVLIRSRTIIYDPLQDSTSMNASIDNFLLYLRSTSYANV